MCRSVSLSLTVPHGLSEPRPSGSGPTPTTLQAPADPHALHPRGASPRTIAGNVSTRRHRPAARLQSPACRLSHRPLFTHCGIRQRQPHWPTCVSEQPHRPAAFSSRLAQSPTQFLHRPGSWPRKRSLRCRPRPARPPPRDPRAICECPARRSRRSQASPPDDVAAPETPLPAFTGFHSGRHTSSRKFESCRTQSGLRHIDSGPRTCTCKSAGMLVGPHGNLRIAVADQSRPG